MTNTLQAILPAIGQLMAERRLIHPIEILAESVHGFFIRITQRTADAALETSKYPENLERLEAFPLTLRLSDALGEVSTMQLDVPQGGADERTN